MEFARPRREEGLTIEQSAMEAARVRLRPILMTSFAFILGVLPLTIATGAGAAGRHSLGTAVFGGMVVSTILNLVVVPVFYVVIERLRERFGAAPTATGPAAPSAPRDSLVGTTQGLHVYDNFPAIPATSAGGASADIVVKGE